MSGFIDFADVKVRCSIEQATKLLDLKTTEERSQLRAPCPVCGGGPGRESKGRSGLDDRPIGVRYCTVERYGTKKTSSPRLIISNPTTSLWKRSVCPNRQLKCWGFAMRPRA
jgi:hypothetical protein